MLGGAGLAYLTGDKLMPETPPIGYQGKIKDYEIVRERVPGTIDTKPRSPLSGARARRFFSDRRVVENPNELSDVIKTPAVEAKADSPTFATREVDPSDENIYTRQLAGSRQYTQAEREAGIGDVGLGYTDDGRVIYSAGTQDDFRQRVTSLGDPILGEVIPAQVEDPDNEGELIANTLARDPNTGRQILNQEAFDALTADTLLTEDGLSLGQQLNLGAEFDAEGRLLLPAEQDVIYQSPDETYDEQGRLISPAAYYTNLEAARLDAREQAAGLAGLVYDPVNQGYRERIMPDVEAEVVGDPAATTARFNPTNPYTAGEVFEQTGGAGRPSSIGGQAGIAGDTIVGPVVGPIRTMANGGLSALSGEEKKKRAPINMYSGFLGGATKGQADEVPATIEGSQPAALSDGEFVLTADVVAHLGDGNSEAGAKILDDFMKDVRKEATGTEQQAKEINGESMLGRLKKKKNFSKGGLASFSMGGGTSGATAGTAVGTDTGVNQFFGDYVAGALGLGQAAADQPYDAYAGYGATYTTDDEGNRVLDESGLLTAGSSELQDTAFTAAGDIDTRGFGELTQDELTGTDSGQVDAYGNPIMTGGLMNPYIQGALNPQLREARRQAEQQALSNQARMTQAGAYGGSRSAIMEMMNQRDLNQQLADITAKGYNQAYTDARDQFGKDRQFGLDAIQRQADLGQTQSDILQTAIDADKTAFEAERDYDQKIPQYLMDLLQGMPVASKSNVYSQQSDLAQLLSNTGMYGNLFGAGGDSDVAYTDDAGVQYTVGTDVDGNPTLVQKT